MQGLFIERQNTRSRKRSLFSPSRSNGGTSFPVFSRYLIGFPVASSCISSPPHYERLYFSSSSRVRNCSRKCGLFCFPCLVIAWWTASSRTSSSVPEIATLQFFSEG